MFETEISSPESYFRRIGTIPSFLVMIVHPFTTSIHNTKFILSQTKCTGLKFLLLEDVRFLQKKFSRFSEFPFTRSFIQQAAKSGTDKDTNYTVPGLKLTLDPLKIYKTYLWIQFVDIRRCNSRSLIFLSGRILICVVPYHVVPYINFH